MVIVSLVFLFVYLFGAYAYGAATVYGIRQISPLWGEPSRSYAPGVRRRIDRAGLRLFALSTVWFVLHVLIEFRNFAGARHDSLLDLGTLIVYLFPPVIMHTVYLESQCDDAVTPPPLYRYLLSLMYVVSPLIGAWVIGAIFDMVPRPRNIGMWIGITIGGLFTAVSIYSTALMLRRPPRPRTSDQLRLRNVMIALFAGLSAIFIILLFMREQQILARILEHVTRASPIFFMIASVYFENRFEFYDLVVKRAVLILLSVLVLGVFLVAALPGLMALPAGMARPWLFAVALAPVAMVMPWLMNRTERLLDRLWLGREFTPVEAVKHVLAAMQPATDEQSLIAAAEARLSEIMGARIRVFVGPKKDIEHGVEIDVALASPV